jgi:hypothetical protein
MKMPQLCLLFFLLISILIFILILIENEFQESPEFYYPLKNFMNNNEAMRASGSRQIFFKESFKLYEVLKQFKLLKKKLSNYKKNLLKKIRVNDFIYKFNKNFLKKSQIFFCHFFHTCETFFSLRSLT